MNIEEARRIANAKFTKVIQPVIDGVENDSEKVTRQVDLLKQEIAQETGYEVESFYVTPFGFGVYEVTTTFKTGETRRAVQDSQGGRNVQGNRVGGHQGKRRRNYGVPSL